MGVNRMTGTSWHVESLHRKDDDDRRHKHRCAFYRVKDNECELKKRKCMGSAHCGKYRELSPEAYKIRQEKINKARAEKRAETKAKNQVKKETKKDDEIYWWG